MIFIRQILQATRRALLATACLALTTLPAYAQQQETVWFVVAEPEALEGPLESREGGAFLLPLSNPANIAEARRLIEEDPGFTSGVSARIAIGGDGLNRDTLADVELAWSWRVVQFRGFFEVAVGLCNGASPAGIELAPAFFFGECSSTVGFEDYLPVAELEEPPAFFISEGLNGTWYNLETAGQGVTVDVLAERGEVFLTWVTYADGGPTGPPADEQAWITAQGPFTGNAATLDAYVTTGGAFDAPKPVTTRPIGEIELEFSDCNHGVLSYAFDDGQSGQFPIRRLINRPGCVSRLADLRRRDEPAD